jgi:hypothetical protein
MNPSFSAKKRRFRLVAFSAVIAIWALLYLPHLGSSPRWYGDETITIACGHDLVRGVFANRGTWNTYVNPQFCYQPGYVAAVGGLSLLTGRDILAPRLLNVLLALGIAQTVIHFRWVYAHNAVAAGFFLCLAVLCLRRTASRDWAAGAGLALAAAAHPLSLYGGIAAFLCRWRSPRSWIPLFLPPLIVGLLVLAPVFFWKPAWFLEDIGHLSAFYKMYGRDFGGGTQGLKNFVIFFLQDPFHILAGLAAVFALFRPVRPLGLAALLFIVLLTSNRQNLPVFYYQAVIALPLLAACLAYGIWSLARRLPRKRRAWGWVVFLLPAILLTQSLPHSLRGDWKSRNDPWVAQAPAELREAANWINAHTDPDDLVLAHWNTGWLLECRTGDLLQATAWAGLPTHTFEHQIPHERFRFPLAVREAKFVVLADIDFAWTIHNPNVDKIIEDNRLNQWPVVFRAQSVLILRNPEKP